MLNKVNKNLINTILIILLLNMYIFKIEILNKIVIITGIVIVLFANRHTLKQLSLWQIIRIITLFAGTVVLLVSLFYFVASPLVDLITIDWINFLVKIVLVIGILVPSIGLLYKGISKITKETFPEGEIKQINYPDNDEIKQLVIEGRDIEAVKRARELYGYSLLEAKQYIDQLS